MHDHRFADDGVADAANVLNPLYLGILEEVFLDERVVYAHIDVLVDGRRHHEPTVTLIERGQVGAATAEGDPQWGPGDDHEPVGLDDTSRQRLMRRTHGQRHT